MSYCAFGGFRNLPDSKHSNILVLFPLPKEFTDSYENRLKPWERTEGGVGLYSHPPFHIWMGGAMKPISGMS